MSADRSESCDRLRAWAERAAEVILAAIAIAGGAAYYVGTWGLWRAILGG